MDMKLKYPTSYAFSEKQGGRAFVEGVFANFRDKNIVFLQLRENRPFVVVKRLAHTQARSLKHPFWCLDMYFGYVLVVRKLSKSGLSKSSTKALWKLSESSPKALWKLYESRLYESSLKALRKQALRKLSESSPKALRKLSESSLKALRKLSENSLETLRKLYESYLKVGSLKACWLLLEALQKQADFRWKHSQSRMTFVESSMVAIQKARKSRQY